MEGTIDRFEGNYAIIETEDFEYVNVELDNLPEGCKEGDILVMKNGVLEIDYEETEKRNKAINDIMEIIMRE